MMAYIIVKFVATAATMDPTAKNKDDRRTSYIPMSLQFSITKAGVIPVSYQRRGSSLQ
jgi:hypothetical protein